jgi:hypothetical protein
MNIILNSESNNYCLGDYLINKYENVKEYKYTLCKPELILKIETETHNTNNSNKDIYYIFDCPGEDALIHWIIESFMFYPIFIKLKNIFPNIKIITSNTKRYVKNIFNFIGIESNLEQAINNINNICFFPKVISLNELNINDINLYKNFIENMINDFNILSVNNCLIKNKILLLPRNNKDNYIRNDRVLLGIDDIIQNIINKDGVVLDTYNINNISFQLFITESSEIIILDYGSSFFFNCLFVKNKKIIMLNYNGLYDYQVNNFISLKIMYEIISKNNTVIIVSSNNNIITYNDIERYL